MRCPSARSHSGAWTPANLFGTGFCGLLLGNKCLSPYSELEILTSQSLLWRRPNDEAPLFADFLYRRHESANVSRQKLVLRYGRGEDLGSGGDASVTVPPGPDHRR